jgi:hypothetical protein
MQSWARSISAVCADTSDGLQEANADATGMPYVIPGLDVTQPYDGEVAQLDVTAVQ